MPKTIYTPDDTRVAAVPTTGGAGVSTGTVKLSGIRGKIKSIDIAYDGSAPATTVVTINAITKAGNTVPVVVVPAGNTDLHLVPRSDVNDDAAAVIASVYDEWDFNKWTAIDVVVTLSDDLTPAVTVALNMEDGSAQAFWDSPEGYNP